MSKLPNTGVTIFTRMSQLAAQHKAINLSQGFPDFEIDDALRGITKKNIDNNIHQYMPMKGSPDLLIAVSQLIKQRYGKSVEPFEELLITAGASEGIFSSIIALVDQGDEVIVLDPSYDCYDPAIRLAGGTPVHVSLNTDFLPDWEAVKSAITARTKMVITNNPHNPSGRVWRATDFKAFETLLNQHKKLIWLSDEVYEFIHFHSHISAHSISSLAERCIIVSSFGKTFHITGWKVGYLYASASLMREIQKVHQYNVFSVNSVAQAVLAEYLPTVDISTLGKFYDQKRALFAELLSNSRFRLLPCEGTYFQLADYSAISDAPDVQFCEELTIKYGVAAIPVSVFNQNGKDQKLIRFCFAKKEETLIQAAKKLCAI